MVAPILLSSSCYDGVILTADPGVFHLTIEENITFFFITCLVPFDFIDLIDSNSTDGIILPLV